MNQDNYPTVCIARDTPDEMGVHHHYVICACDEAGEPVPSAPVLASVKFQKGDDSVSGCSDADLIGIVMHRLSALGESLESPGPCLNALQSLGSVLYWLSKLECAPEVVA